ncbi:MAG: phytanoyl-CoA dioxygenase family protein [Pseudomonadales bacterium]
MSKAQTRIAPELRAFKASEFEQLQLALQQDGACIALDMLSAAQCDQLNLDFADHLSALQQGQDDLGYREAFYGSHTKRLHGLFSKSAQTVSLLLHPTLQALTTALLIDPEIAHDVRLSNAELMVLYQGQRQQAYHRDAASWQRAARMDTSDFLVSANFALTDFTAQNGATWVAPGSHRWNPMREPTSAEVCQAVMPKGSALLYLGNAVHAGGANTSTQARVGLYMGFMASWLRPLENQLLTNQTEDLLALPASAQRLLDITPGGYTVYA